VLDSAINYVAMDTGYHGIGVAMTGILAGIIDNSSVVMTYGETVG
jgi:hypothetical protein